LLPVYDKPLIYYPLATLMSAGINRILVITTPNDQAQFRELLGDGSQWGVEISFASQPKPEGLAQAFIIGEEFIAGETCALVLGDNIFHGEGLGAELRSKVPVAGSTIFGYKVRNPSAYGVVEIDDLGGVISIEEKPTAPRSQYAIPGLYFFDQDVVSIARGVKPSARGELEITSVMQGYLDRGNLRAHVLPEGTTWLDSGTFNDLHDASSWVRIVEERLGTKIGCIEEIAWRNGWITDEQLLEHGRVLGPSGYGRYLSALVQ
jgi:glucose-1-phosphate thymidylyltransferase